MSFLYDTWPQGALSNAVAVRLVLNVYQPPSTVPVAHTPGPADPFLAGFPVDRTLFGVSTVVTSSVTAGVLATAAAELDYAVYSTDYYTAGNPNGTDGPLVQVVGVMLFASSGGSLTPLAFFDGAGFPFTPPDWFENDPAPPEFHVIWNPAGGALIDPFTSSGGQTASSSFDAGTGTLTITPATLHPTPTFGEHALELVGAPQFIAEPGLVIPISFGDPVAGPEPTIASAGFVIPVVFGDVIVTPGSPDDPEPPPPEIPPSPGASVVSATADPIAGAVPVRGLRPVG
jgi:hypothetical protein